jgi:hypothetical protein
MIELFLGGFFFFFFYGFWILGLWIALIIFGPRVSVDENAILLILHVSTLMRFPHEHFEKFGM